MKIKLDPAKKPVMVKVCHYRDEQQNFPDAYISQSVKLVYLHPSELFLESGSPPGGKKIDQI